MLFIVDIQNNFINREGNMYIEGSEDLIPVIIEKIKSHREKGDYIFYTLDVYVKKEKHKANINNIENIEKKEEKANEKEKWNFELPDELKPYLEEGECIKKSYYSLPPEELLSLQDRFKKEHRVIREIEFVGVETHICVLSNAVSLRSAFPDAEIIINKDLCKSSSNSDHNKALEIMKGLGMTVGGI